MAEMITLRVNGAFVAVPQGTSVAVSIMLSGMTAFRRSVSGEGRGPLCGMGVCFECCAIVNGQAHVRTCQLLAENAMEVRTDDAL